MIDIFKKSGRIGISRSCNLQFGLAHQYAFYSFVQYGTRPYNEDTFGNFFFINDIVMI